MQKRRQEVENADRSANAYLQPCATSAPIKQNAGSAPLVGAASTQGAHLQHCNSQGSPSEAADPSSHGQRALRHELNEPSHTGSPVSPDTLEVVFASTSPSVVCNFLLEQAYSGNEECKKELDRILGAVASRNLCANVPDVHAGSDENQPSNNRPRRMETHARVKNSIAWDPGCKGIGLHRISARTCHCKLLLMKIA
jgi:hypothetical protein